MPQAIPNSKTNKPKLQALTRLKPKAKPNSKRYGTGWLGKGQATEA